MDCSQRRCTLALGGRLGSTAPNAGRPAEWSSFSEWLVSVMPLKCPRNELKHPANNSSMVRGIIKLHLTQGGLSRLRRCNCFLERSFVVFWGRRDACAGVTHPSHQGLIITSTLPWGWSAGIRMKFLILMASFRPLQLLIWFYYIDFIAFNSHFKYQEKLRN